MATGARLVGTALLLLLGFVSVYASPAPGLLTRISGGPRQPSDISAVDPPATVQTFLVASAANSTMDVDRVTSPAYWLELRRRGVDPDQERPEMILKGVTYVSIGGARDGYGYGHWLYATRVESRSGEWLLTIWRVDTDPSDLVLWIEPGLLLANACDQPIRDSTTRSIQLSGTPADTATLVLSARCPRSSAGYYILRNMGIPTFTFTTIHEDGETWQSRWSFGKVVSSGKTTGGHDQNPVDGLLKSTDEEVYQSYLRDLNVPNLAET